jgi:hypothetical protein
MSAQPGQVPSGGQIRGVANSTAAYRRAEFVQEARA